MSMLLRRHYAARGIKFQGETEVPVEESAENAPATVEETAPVEEVKKPTKNKKSE